MFDIGFSEIVLFGAFALIVLGPEKLPQAVRSAGRWYAKIRFTLSSVQNDIEQEFNIAETRRAMQDELAKIKEAEQKMQQELQEIRGNMNRIKQEQTQEMTNLSENNEQVTDTKNIKTSNSLPLMRTAENVLETQ